MARTTHGDLTMAAEAGARVINDAALHVISASMVELSADAIVTTLTIEGSGTNVVGEYISSPVNPTGAHSLCGASGKLITSIQLSAGTCAYAH